MGNIDENGVAMGSLEQAREDVSRAIWFLEQAMEVMGVYENDTELIEQLMLHEGMRKHPYRCTAGKTTIGIGRNLEGKGITRQEAVYLLKHDIRECAGDCLAIFGDVWEELSPVRQRVLIDMRFNLGPSRFRTFRRMIDAVKRKDFKGAAREMMDSRWATQVGTRALRLHDMMLDG